MLLFAVVTFALIVGASYRGCEHRWRWRWREVETGIRPALVEGDGVYRRHGVVPTFHARAPDGVRVAAFTSLVSAHLSMIALGLGVASLRPTAVTVMAIACGHQLWLLAVMVALKQLAAGRSLLARDPATAYTKARDAATWSLWLYGLSAPIAIALSLPAIVDGLGVPSLLETARAHPAGSALVLGWITASVVQALYLRAVAIAHRPQLEAPTHHVL
jgi:hypothetical protein